MKLKLTINVPDELIETEGLKSAHDLEIADQVNELLKQDIVHLRGAIEIALGELEKAERALPANSQQEIRWIRVSLTETLKEVRKPG